MFVAYFNSSIFFKNIFNYQELETSVTVGSADPPSNFYYGECSSHPQLSQTFVNDHMQLEASFGMYDPVLDQPDNMAGQYGQDTNLVQDGDYGELNLGENPLNFNFASDDPDLYFDATGYLTSLGEEYMETNDVENLDEISPPEIDPSVAAMLDEYLNYPAGDISKHISFDSPLSIGCESPIANPVQPFIEQVIVYSRFVRLFVLLICIIAVLKSLVVIDRMWRTKPMVVPWQTNRFLKHSLVMKLSQRRIQRCQVGSQVTVPFALHPDFSS